VPAPYVTPERVYVALGSNLGDRAAHLALARTRLAELPHTRLAAASRVEETAPIGPITQGQFLNQMVLLETSLEPEQLLDHCLTIERDAGRVRRERWGPRTLDLDIVRFGQRELTTPRLTIPHPEIANRPFWLRELAELDALVPARG
jgi:2-amino-4-hydroxy-6-hydroxymethyldihydropteridine diphosphokinase